MPTHSPTLRIVVYILMLYFGSSSVRLYARSTDTTQSPPSSQKVLKNRLMFPKGKVLLHLPKGLRAFGTEDFAKHFGQGHTPEYAFIDDSTESRIAISVTPSLLSDSELPSYKSKMELALPRSVKGLIWFKREMLKIGDVEWIHLEMENIAADGNPVMNDLYVTSFGGHPLMFTITTDPKHWYEIRKRVQKMMLSVMIQELPERTGK